MLNEVAAPMREQKLITANHKGNVPDAEEMHRIITDTANSEGFTVSGTTWGINPTSGCCVTLPGSHMKIRGDMFDRDGFMSKAAKSQIDMFRNVSLEALESGNVYFGGYRWPNGDYEINLTLVLPSEHENLAASLAETWNQKSYFRLDDYQEVDTGGDGGKSIYTTRQPKLKRRWWQPWKKIPATG